MLSALAVPGLLGLLAATSPAATGAPATNAVVIDRIAAVVGDDLVLESELARLVAVEVIPRRPEESAAAYRDRVLLERIVELLRERELRQTGGFEPEPSEVEARLSALGERLEREGGESLDAVLSRAGVTRREAADWIRRGLAIETYARERILPTIRISSEDVQQYYAGTFAAEARAKGLETLPPLSAVEDELRELLRERRLEAEIARWTEGLRGRTRVLIYRRPPVSVPGPSARR